MDGSEEEQEIVIVGAGICGLATALALHRKGVRSVVLERSKTLRASGGGIGIWANGWCTLEQLGVASDLRKTALPIQRFRDVWLDKGLNQETPVTGEARCLMRSDLIRTLADALPPGTIHFGCQIVSVKMDPSNSYPILQLLDGSFIVAKILIGCDGLNSVVANFLELKPTKEFGSCAVRGLTNYPNGHAFPHELVRTRRNGIVVGVIPINDKLVYWFVGQQAIREGADHAKGSQRPELIRELILQSIDGFPPEVAQLIEDSELESLSLTRLRYRAPWDLLLGKFRKGTVTVAGDAMHVMGPFLGQGGSAALEDAIVLARCLSRKFVNPVDRVPNSERETTRMMMIREVGEAIDQYVKERRMRVVRLSMHTYLIGSLLKPSSLLVKFACIVFMVVFFRNANHTRYDCGLL
ncbi:monooxygenase 1-like isoform X1 [Rhododendron vialii]|uniref:monooxygenase 1-like isoform X1 n=1 Tax=Rhododendron vialii TaxID=182163 RepID=UPI00265DB42A|nr:monooxygenase 1-like isoform X1 [Rhododendron vialii]